jgi:hypothetical protein
MEKDHFLDRPIEIMYRNNVPNGAKVFICTKQMQPYAKTLKDLNLITITGNLTSTATHSRGQKVQGEEILTDKYGNYLLDANDNLIKKETKGRCTYLVTPDGSAILTKDGYKYLEIFEDIDGKYKYKILTEDQIIGKYKLVALFKLNPEFEFRLPICNFKYFKSLEELTKEAKTIKINKATLYNGFIILEMNNYKIKLTDVFAEWGTDNKIKISSPEFIEYLSNNYQSSNNTTYAFNKNYNLEFISFIAEEY